MTWFDEALEYAPRDARPRNAGLAGWLGPDGEQRCAWCGSAVLARGFSAHMSEWKPIWKPQEVDCRSVGRCRAPSEAKP